MIRIAAVLLMVEVSGASAGADDPVAGAAPARSTVLQDERLTESSGLAKSLRRADHFWSHNDSGGQNRLFAFDVQGRRTGTCRIAAAGAVDWEDMASFAQDGQPRLLVADCGDNDSRRESVQLYLVAEPDPHRETEVRECQTIQVRYPDGPRDCEAVCVDPVRGQIVMIAKSRLPSAGIYTLPLPPADGRSRRVTAQRVGTLRLPMITAMDLDPTTGDLWLASYLQAFRFACRARDEPLADQLARLPQPHRMPRLRQIEALAITDPNTVWVTTEGSPAMLNTVTLDATAAPREPADP